MKHISILFSLLWLFTVSCGSSYDNASFKSDSAINSEAYQPASASMSMAEDDSQTYKQASPVKPQTINEEQTIEQQLIKRANVSLLVKDYKSTRPKILELVKAAKGYVSSDTEENSSYRTGGSLEIRVPQQTFDNLLAHIVELAEIIENKNISVQDVTEEFVDIKARLKTKREVEQRYVEILKQAKNVSEILEVEEQLRKLREEIESKEGRLKYLQNQVGYSTISLSLYQRHTESVYTPSFFDKIGDALSGGWIGIQTFVIGLIYLWPFLIIFAVVFWIVRRKIIRRKASKN